MKQMRQSLKQQLEAINCPPPKGLKSWNHITDQIGMFCFTGLSETQSKKLCDEYAIFLTTNGRISVSGLNTKNVQYVAESFKDVLSKY